WIRFANVQGFEDARHPATSDTAFRDNGRIEVWDERVAEGIWLRLKALVPERVDGWKACGCYEKLRVYRYKAGGQRFGKHIDESTGGTKPGTRTAITVLIYLNGSGGAGVGVNTEGEGTGRLGRDSEVELVGGETVFYRGVAGNSEAARFAPLAGAMLWHGHGERCLVHEALAVNQGVKYVLRTDVLFERP
ncbi:unnamed protein product, partial [Ostreobium quekettii]